MRKYTIEGFKSDPASWLPIKSVDSNLTILDMAKITDFSEEEFDAIASMAPNDVLSYGDLRITRNE